VDDPHFNIEYHLRHTALPTPGGESELRKLVGRVMSQQLDRSKSLWEIWVVEGLEDGRWAMLSKTHHAMVDGVAGTDLLAVIMDPHARRRAARA
jgi:diacylglycerol O-acyltransferase